MSQIHLVETAATDAGNPAIGELLDAANAAVRELLHDCPPGDPMQARLRNVQQTMERLATLTGRLAASEQRLAPRATPLDLNGIVREMVAPLQRVLGPFITLETALYSPAVWVRGNRSAIEQITLGLVINAREALPLGGKVRLTTRRWALHEQTHYRIGALGPGEWAVLEVRDNGARVDDGGVRHLIEPSTRGVRFDSSLDLAAISNVVTDAGGQVILDIPTGGGTILAACFPVAEAPRARQPATGTASAILIVDDNEWSRTSSARTLRHAGFGVLEASHGDDALELLDDVAGSCVRLMMVDASLLDADAVPLGERIRRERPEIELLVTADHRASTGGSERYPVLTKPFSADELLRTIRARFLALA